MLKKKWKYVALSNLSIYYTRKNIKISGNNNKFEISKEILINWRIIFYIRYSRLLQLYHPKHETVTDNLPIRIFLNMIENKVTFKI